MKTKFKNGFTIVELLVVIVVIGVLAAISIVSYVGVSTKATIASVQSDLVNTSGQFKVFQVNNGGYPTAINCSNPAATEICVKVSPGNVFEGYSYNNSASPQSFRIRVRNVASGIVYIITDNSAPVAYTPIPPTTFSYTGSYQTYTVPADVDSVIIEAWGAQGYFNGEGGYAKGTLSVSAGEVLRVYIGGQGVFNNYCNQAPNQGAGYNGGGGANCYGGGGGGASDVRRTPYGLNDRIIVGAGGGGNGISYGDNAGFGGGLVGQAGSGGPAPGGGGGTQSAGGTVSNGGNGSFGQGGYPAQYFSWGGSGGGGGGWYGGAAGGTPSAGAGGAGGGGSSYVIPSATSVSYQTGGRTGNGQVIITPI